MESFSEKALKGAQQCNDIKRYQQSAISHSFCADLLFFWKNKEKPWLLFQSKVYHMVHFRKSL